MDTKKVISARGFFLPFSPAVSTDRKDEQPSCLTQNPTSARPISAPRPFPSSACRESAKPVTFILQMPALRGCAVRNKERPVNGRVRGDGAREAAAGERARSFRDCGRKACRAGPSPPSCLRPPRRPVLECIGPRASRGAPPPPHDQPARVARCQSEAKREVRGAVETPRQSSPRSIREKERVEPRLCPATAATQGAMGAMGAIRPSPLPSTGWPKIPLCNGGNPKHTTRATANHQKKHLRPPKAILF